MVHRQAEDALAPSVGPRDARSTSAPRWPEIALVAALTVAGLALCLHRIGTTSLWLDEAFSVAGSGDLARSWRDRGGSMGLYYSLLSVWAEPSSSPGWVRLPSAVFAAATVPFVYLIGREVGGRRVALYAASLLVVSWGFVRYGQEARSYSMVLLLAAISWWTFLRIVRSPATWPWVAYGIASGLVGYAHPLGVLVIAPQVVCLAAVSAPFATLRRWAPGLALAAVLVVPLVVLIVTSSGAEPERVPSLRLRQFEQLQTQFGGTFAVGTWAMTAGWVIGTAVVVRRMFSVASGPRRMAWLVPALWFWVPIAGLAAISAVQPTFAARYLLGSLPAACLLVAAALDALPHRVRSLALVVLVALSLVSVGRLWESPRQDWAAVVEHVADPREPTVIAFADPDLRVPFEHALLASGDTDGVVPLAPPHSWGALPRYLPDVPLDELVDELAEADALWVVDWGHQPDSDPLGGRMPQILDHPAVAGSFCPANDTRFDGSILVLRLERSTGVCD
ncbi:MAG: glycosyltransferase family 39 protein [Acidimicrobiia bacterium]|nr:glycosyltransferase family 39 protein [Acidimicrobiia bacterium]